MKTDKSLEKETLYYRKKRELKAKSVRGFGSSVSTFEHPEHFAADKPLDFLQGVDIALPREESRCSAA